MRQFFRGWKRKLGVITLLLACALTAGWIQTYSALDILITKWFSIASLDSTLGIILETKRAAQWHTVAWQHGDPTKIESVIASDSEWKWRFLGFGYVSSPTMTNTAIVFVPYWMLVIPMAVLAAWLLLSPKRSRTPVQTTESQRA